jgi:hypothetical protein
MVYGVTDIVDRCSGGRLMGFGGPWDMNVMRKQNILGNLSVIVRRETVDSVGGYDEALVFRRNCDWDLWLRIGARFQVGRVNKSVGCSMARLSDSIGMRVGLSDKDWEEIRGIQARPDRRVRLQGEMRERAEAEKDDGRRFRAPARSEPERDRWREMMFKQKGA